MKYNEAVQALDYGREKKFSLVGDEPYLKNRFVSRVRSICKEEVFELWPDGVEDAVGALSGGLFGDGGSVILHHIDEMDMERLAKALPESSRMVVAVFQEDCNLKARSASTFIGKTSTVECNRLREYGDEYAAWVSTRISSAGYIADDGVVQAVCSKVGTDLSTLDSELRKLFILKLETKHIEVSDVDKSVSRTSTRTAYDILDGLIKGDVPAALACFDAHPSSDGCLEVVAFLFAYMEKMYRMLLLRDRKHSVDAIADILGMSKFLVGSKYLPKALTLGKSFFIKRLNQLGELDLGIRSFKGEKRVLIERFMYSFVPQD